MDNETQVATRPNDPLETGDTFSQFEKVVGYSPYQLLARAVAHPKGWKAGHVRWAAVGDVFCVGSTTATNLCKALQIDPHEKRKLYV